MSNDADLSKEPLMFTNTEYSKIVSVRWSGCESKLKYKSYSNNVWWLFQVKNRGIKLTGKHGIPEDSIGMRGLTLDEVNTLNQRDRSDKASTYRPKDESAEERSDRKKAVKQERKVKSG